MEILNILIGNQSKCHMAATHYTLALSVAFICATSFAVMELAAAWLTNMQAIC